MIRRLSVCLWPALIVSLAVLAQEPKGPSQTAESKPEAAAVSPIELAVAAERADRARQQQAIAWLSKPTDVSFTDTPLGDVVKFLADFHDARIRLDATAKPSNQALALENAPISVNIEKQPLSHVLHRIALSAEAVWTVHRGDIVITTGEHELELRETRVYPVGRLLRLLSSRAVLAAPAALPQVVSGFFRPGPLTMEEGTESTLMRFVEESTSVPWLTSSGEGGSMSMLGDQLIVRQTYHGHEELSRLLNFTELALERAPGSPPVLVLPPEDTARLARIQKALRGELEMHFVQTPLLDVIAFLHDRLEEEIYADHSTSLKQAAPANQEMSLPEGRYAVREALQRMLAPHMFAAVIDDGAIRITTDEQAKLQLLPVIYDVADLVRTSDEAEALRSSIRDNIDGPWMESEGEGGTLSELLGGLLVIRQSESVHTEVALLLQDLRKARKDTAKDATATKSTELETRFHKAKSKDEAEALERLILTFVAPNTWDVSGGRGVLRTAEDRLILQQTKAVHEQIDQFLREYQQAKPIGTSK